MELYETAPSSWDQALKVLIDRTVWLPFEAKEDARHAALSSQSMMLIKAFFDQAIEISVRRGFAPGSAGSWEVVCNAYDIAEKINSSGPLGGIPLTAKERAKLTVEEANEIFSITSRTDAKELVLRAKLGHRLALDPIGLEIAIGSYLKSEFRPRFADRLLLIALFDLEITAHFRNLHYENFVEHQPLATPRLRSPRVARPVDRGWAKLFTGIISYLKLPINWSNRQGLDATLSDDMIALYSEIHSVEPLSVKRMRQQAEKLSHRGAIWLRSIWTLLDDMEARGVVTLTE